MNLAYSACIRYECLSNIILVLHTFCTYRLPLSKNERDFETILERNNALCYVIVHSRLYLGQENFKLDSEFTLYHAYYVWRKLCHSISIDIAKGLLNQSDSRNLFVGSTGYENAREKPVSNLPVYHKICHEKETRAVFSEN